MNERIVTGEIEQPAPAETCIEMSVLPGTELRIGDARMRPSVELLEHLRTRTASMPFIREIYLFHLATGEEEGRLAIGLWMPEAEQRAEEAAGIIAPGLRSLVGPDGIDIVCITDELLTLVRARCAPIA